MGLARIYLHCLAQILPSISLYVDKAQTLIHLCHHHFEEEYIPGTALHYVGVGSDSLGLGYVVEGLREMLLPGPGQLLV